MTDWSRERWRKLYLREPKDQEIWQWQARGLRDLLIRIAEDDGRLGRDVPALQRLLRAGDDVSPFVRDLLDDGFLEQRDDGLYVRNLPEAQGSEPPTRPAPRSRRRPPSSSGTGGGRWANTSQADRSAAAQRASEARWGRRTGDASTDPHDASTDAGDGSLDASVTDRVTDGDASFDGSSPRAVSGSSDPSESLPEERKEERREEERSQSARASDASTHDASTHSDVTHRRRTDDASTDATNSRRLAGSRPTIVQVLPEKISARDLVIPAPFKAYALELGHTALTYQSAVDDFREKVTTAGTAAWLASKLCRFIEKAAPESSGSSEPRRAPPVADHTLRPVEMGPPVTLVPRPQRKAVDPAPGREERMAALRQAAAEELAAGKQEAAADG